jgi:hypothetical protein
MPKLTVQNAEIKTATVQIQTLTVSGKQVTLAVFRQLREELLLAENGTLNGVPWGTVNYHPDKCVDDHPHWHIVWQRDTDLLRARVYQTPRWSDRVTTTVFGLIPSHYWHECGCRHKFPFDLYSYNAVEEGLIPSHYWHECGCRHKFPFDLYSYNAVEEAKEAFETTKLLVQARHMDIRQPLIKLPQLFIAV